MGLLFWYGSEISRYDLSVFFTVFVMLQFWNMFNAKGFGTSVPIWKATKGCSAFFGVLLLILVGQILIVSFGGEVFRTTPISWQDWLIVIGSTSIVMWVGEIYRLLKRE